MKTIKGKTEGLNLRPAEMREDDIPMITNWLFP